VGIRVPGGAHIPLLKQLINFNKTLVKPCIVFPSGTGCAVRLTLLRLKPWGGGGGASVVGSDQVGDVALIEAPAQAPWMLRVRFRGSHRVGESRSVAKLQVSSLRRVRVNGKYLHHCR
jgi:hypothetical protein